MDEPKIPSKQTRNIGRYSPLLIAAAVLAVALVSYLFGRRATNQSAPIATTEAPAETGSDAEKTAAESAGAKEIRFTPESERLAGIAVAPAKLASLATGIPFNGQIALNPNGVVRVASVVPGRVTRLAVSQGDTVRAGEVVAVVESRSIGEAQAAYQQARARFANARSNLDVVLKQARAGVFSRAPVEVARKAQVEAASDVRTQETAVRQTRTALDNALRLALMGSFASPALEAARGQANAATESVRTAQAALTNAQASVEAAQSELRRRRELSAAGAYQSRPVEEARRALVAAQSARAQAQSEVATTRANLSRAKSLAAEGLVSQRDLEAAQQAYDTATSRLETTQADEAAAQQELQRQQKVASTDVAGAAEVQAAQSTLATAQADVRTRNAEVERARQGVRLAQVALSRERAVFGQNIANRREVSTAQSALENAQTALIKARQSLALSNATLEREGRIYRQNLNNIAPVQTARAGLVQAQADLNAAQSTLSLLKSAPGDSVAVPIRAPISGIVQERNVALGELVQADAPLMTIANLRTLALEAALYEKDIARVRYGSIVSVTVEALPGRTFSGRISFLGSQLDAQTRTLMVRALIENPGQITPGMSARGQIQTGSGALAVSVPADAVQTMNGEPVVFVPADKAGEFTARPVQTGETSNGQTAIASGLKPGEKIVVKGAFMVKSQAMKGALGDED
jgi:RND family efflux transporter MFP subunit